MSEVFRWVFIMLFGLPGGTPAGAQDISVADPAPISISTETSQATCDGVLKQGGLIICKAAPGTDIRIGGVTLATSADGTAQFGIARAAPLTLGLDLAGDLSDIEIEPRADESTTINGIPCDKIDARTPEQKAHAAKSWEKKQAGWASFHEGRGARDGFIKPAEGRLSSPFGFSRSYVTVGCDPKTKVHWGYDIAAPTGAPIVAPAAGTVVLAEHDLYYEGGTVFLDHGHGLMSIFLHMSELETSVGDVVAAGDPIGKIGATGRVTGPHLHWAVKWRDSSRSDRKGDFYIDPALLLQLPKN